MNRNADPKMYKTLADLKDLSHELHHLLLLVARAAEAREDGAIGFAAEVGLAIVAVQTHCLSTIEANAEGAR